MLVLGHSLDWLQRLCVVWLSLATAVLTFFVEDPARSWKPTNARWFSSGLLTRQLQAAVVAGVATRAVPNTLTPQPARAAQDTTHGRRRMVATPTSSSSSRARACSETRPAPTRPFSSVTRTPSSGYSAQALDAFQAGVGSADFAGGMMPDAP